MSKEVLTHSESYVKKTNRIILAVGITSFIIFIFGGVLLIKSNKVVDDYEEPVFTDNDDALNIGNTSPLTDNLEFGIVDDGEVPITMTPDPVSMGQVVLGTEAKNVLTIGTNGKTAIKIDDVELAEPPFDGFTYEDNCTDEELRGEQTCNITMNWIPVIHGNVQNNFIISWHEANLTRSNAKSAKVPVEGSAIRKEDCNFCETALPQGAASATEQAKAEIAAKQVRNAVGPNGEVIGTIDEDGYVRDADGNIIGRMNANGLVVDDNGNVIGVGDNRKLVYDEFGNVIGHVNPDGTVVDKDGNVIGRTLPDGTVVNNDGAPIGKAVDAGYVYDENGNIIGRVLPDGTVVDMDGNVIGRLNEKGEVVDANGNLIGYVPNPGRTASDENGNVLGVVMPNGAVVDANGNVVGYVDENGNVVTDEIIGKTGPKRRLAYDKDGNVIGYIDENGNVVDFNGNVIGKMLEDGTLVDLNGNVIGRAGEYVDLALDKDGKVIGYVGADGRVYDKNGNVIGYVDADGNIVSNVKKKIGSLVRVELIPVTPQGTVLVPECWLSTENIQCSCTGGTLEVTVTVRAEGAILCRSTHPGIGSIELGEPLTTPDPEIALRIYYAQAGEELFGIARRFHVSPAQILTANGLEAGTQVLPQAMHFLVPGA